MNQENRYLKAYALGELDDDFIKAQSGPVKARQEKAQSELEKLQSERSSILTVENSRELIEQICRRVKKRFDSLDYEEQRLGLEAMNVTAAVTDNQGAVNAVLGVNEPNTRLRTTGQTSGRLCVDSYSYRTEFILG